MDTELVISSPRSSQTLSRAISKESKPPRIVLGNIDSNKLNQASAYVQVVQAMRQAGQAEEDDVCDAERYQFETIAAYCLQAQHGSAESTLISVVNAKVLHPILKCVEDSTNKLMEQNKNMLQEESQKIMKHNEKKIEELGYQINVQLRNDRMRKKNEAGYSLFLENPVVDDDSHIFPIRKEIPGQMVVRHIKSVADNASTPVLLDNDAPTGESFESMPSTWTEVLNMTHNDILKMCQWYNDGMGIVESHNLVQRQLAVAAWLTGV